MGQVGRQPLAAIARLRIEILELADAMTREVAYARERRVGWEEIAKAISGAGTPITHHVPGGVSATTVQRFYESRLAR